MSYDSKDSKILKQQLRVEEVVVRFEDLGMYSSSGSVVTVDLGEDHTIVAVIDCDNSAPSIAYTPAASCVTTGTSVAITRAAAFAANDKLIIKYIVT